MKIDVRFRGLEPCDGLRAHAVRRIQLRLSRFGREISSVVVRISDVNGPRGGVDTQCLVTVRGRRLAGVIIDDLSGDARSAVSTAVERAGRAVGRDLERMRGVRSPFPIPRRAS